jgi:diguanylate cyclase (GGDEF)-like protein/PAS domain S-box-containing protein
MQAVGTPEGRLQSALWLGGIFLLCSIPSVLLTWLLGTNGYIWPANAVCIAVLCRWPKLDPWAGLAGIGVAFMLLNALTGRVTTPVALGLALANVAEIGLAAWLVLRVLKPRIPRVGLMAALRAFVLAAVLAPLLPCLFAAVVMHLGYGREIEAATLLRWRAHVMSMTVFAPPVLFWSRGELLSLFTRERRRENVLTLIATLAAPALVLQAVPFPFILISVPLLWTAYRMGTMGAVLSSALVAVEVMLLWFTGTRPPSFALVTDPVDSFPLLALACMVLPPVALSLSVGEGRRALATARAAHQELLGERERFRATLESVAEGVLTTDADGLVGYANPVALSILGREAGDILGRHIDEVIVLTRIQSGKPARNLFAKATLRGGVERRVEPCALHRPDGTVRLTRESVSPILRTGGIVTGWVVVVNDVSESYRHDIEIRSRANSDALTGLANRFRFLGRVTEVMTRAHAMGAPASLLVIDLDRFKQVNDSGGHAAGDAVLRAIAARMSAVVHSDDMVARVGGDEFAILLERSDREAALATAGRIVAAITGEVVDYGGVKYSVGASVGVAPLRAPIADAMQWIASADAACYEAKRAGRGCVSEANAEDDRLADIA